MQIKMRCSYYDFVCFDEFITRFIRLVQVPPIGNVCFTGTTLVADK